MCKDYEDKRSDIIDMFPNVLPDEIDDYVEDHIPDGFPESEDE